MNNLTKDALQGGTMVILLSIIVSMIISIMWSLNPIAALLVVILIVSTSSVTYYRYSGKNL